MTAAGAREQTGRQMARTLHFPADGSYPHAAVAALQDQMDAARGAGVQLAIANSIWPQQDHDFNADFLELIRLRYGAAITPVDYATNREAARLRINDWIEANTAGHIRDLIAPGVFTEQTRMVLANAVYFHGRWETPFPSNATHQAPFYLRSGLTNAVALMTRQGEFALAEHPNLQVLELPYAGRTFSMVILLPRDPTGLAAIEKHLTAGDIREWTAGLAPRQVRAFVPRFRIAMALRLDHTLASMGMPDAFDPERADFSGMDGRRGWLHIDAAIHKSYIDVAEEGTEAAAASAVVMAARSAMPAPAAVFRADHPFIFLIRERRSGALLFIGRMGNPAGGG
jgi:serpin B